MLELPCLIDGRYRLDRSVGHGGFGHVYAGVHLTLGVPVAVKVLRLPVDAAAEKRAELGLRFLEEGRVLTRLRHPNIVAALDLGLLPPAADGGIDPYLVMEWVDGSTLDELLRVRGRGFSIAETWALFEPILEALSFAHEAHVVHRDLKPGNVMVVPRAGSPGLGVPRIIDFGIAKIVAPDEAAGSGATETSSPASPFTAAYAAPEQITQSRTGPWTDVHALGLLFVELCTGESPYGHGINVRLEAVDPQRPTPSSRGVDAGPLEEVIAKAVALRPRDRYANAGELLVAARLAARDLDAATTAPTEDPAAVATRRRGAPGPTRPSAAHAELPSQTIRSLRSDPATSTPNRPTKPISRRRAHASSDSATTLQSPEDSGNDAATRGESPPQGRGKSIAIAGAIVIAVGAIAYAAPRLVAPAAPVATATPSTPASTPAPPSAATIRVDRVHALTLDPGCEEFPAFAPDERSIVFSGASGHDYHVIRLDLATNARTTLTHGAGWQTNPSISRDGKSLLYLAVAPEGTAAYETVIESPLGEPDASKLGGIHRRAPKLVVKGTMGPRYSADGTAVWGGDPERPQEVDLATGKVLRSFDPPPKTLLRSIVELDDGRLVADAEDIYTRSLGIVLLSPGQESNPTWILKKPIKATFTISPKRDAVLATVGAPGTASYELWRAPLDGSPATLVPGNTLVPLRGVAFTRAGDRALWSSCDSASDVAPLEPGGAGEWKVPPPSDARRWTDEVPAAIPGTRSLVVRSNRDGDYGLWVIDTAGTTPARKLDTGDLRPLPADVSHDGALVAFAAVDKGIFVIPANGSGKARQVTSDPTHNSPRFSRDDKRLFIEIQSKDDHSWIESVSIDGGPTQRVIGPDTGGPAASPKRDQLVYVRANDGDYDIASFDLATGTSRTLLPKFLPRGGVAFSPDGERFAYASDFEAGEYDLTKHAVTRRFRAGNESIGGVAYAASGPVLVRSSWSGDIWIGDVHVE